LNELVQAGMIPDGEKAQIKQVLPDLLLNAHPKLFKLISASTSVISNYDFPENWPSLMPVRIFSFCPTDTLLAHLVICRL